MSANDNQEAGCLQKKEEQPLNQANSLYELEERFADEGVLPDVQTFTVRQDGEELFGLQV